MHPTRPHLAQQLPVSPTSWFPNRSPLLARTFHSLPPSMVAPHLLYHVGHNIPCQPVSAPLGTMPSQQECAPRRPDHVLPPSTAALRRILRLMRAVREAPPSAPLGGGPPIVHDSAGGCGKLDKADALLCTLQMEA